MDADNLRSCPRISHGRGNVEVFMKRVYLLPLFALAVVACTADSRNPLEPIDGPGPLYDNVPPKPGAHFQSADAELSGSSLTVTFREVGLGEGNVTVQLTADATADYACINNGGEFPNDPRKQSVSGPVSATGTFPVAKNGHVEGSLTVTAPSSTLDCPSGQSVVITSVSYTNVSLTDITNQTSAAIPGTFSAVFFEDVP
jgi:hypothetical protein